MNQLRMRLYQPTVAAYAQTRGPVEFITDTGTSFCALPEEELSERMRRRATKMTNINVSKCQWPYHGPAAFDGFGPQLVSDD